MKLHVELMGLPGSGKSTLHAETLRAAGRTDVRMLGLPEAVASCLSRNPTDKILRGLMGMMTSRLGRDTAARVFARSTDRLSSLAAFLTDNLALAQVVFGSQATQEIPRDDQELVIKWMLGLFAGFRFVEERLTDREVLVIDEGFCNRVTSLFAYGSSGSDPTTEILTYADHIPRPDLVFVLEAGVEVCEERMERRGWTERLALLGPLERRGVLTRSQRCIVVAAARLQQVGVRVVHLPKDGAVATAVKTIDDLLGLSSDTPEPTIGP